MDETVKKVKKDFRIVIVSILRKITGYSIFLFLVFCFWQYKEELNMVNFYRISSYFDIDITSDEGPFQGYNFEVGIDSVNEPYIGGLAILNRDYFKLINPAGVEDLSVQLKYKAPTLSVAERRILAYDKGGKSYSIFGSYSLLKTIETQVPISWAAINQNGDYLIITDEPGYKGVVTAYSASAKEQYKWSTSEYLITSGCINESGKQFAVHCIGGTDSQVSSIIRVNSVDKEEPLYTIDVPGTVVYSLQYDNRGNLVLMGDEGVYTYNSTGKLVNTFPYGKGSLLGFLHKSADWPILAYTTPEGVQMVVYLENGEIKHSFTIIGKIRSLSNDYNKITVLTGERLYIYDTGTKQLAEQVVYGAKKASVRPDGSILMIYGDKAEVLTQEVVTTKE